MFQVHDHHVIPQTQALQIAHQVAVHDGELTGQVRLNRQVAKAGLDRRVYTNDVGDGGSRRDGDAI